MRPSDLSTITSEKPRANNPLLWYKSTKSFKTLYKFFSQDAAVILLTTAHYLQRNRSRVAQPIIDITAFVIER